MRHLSVENFQKAINFIKQHGRPLEQAMVAHMFEDSPVDVVLTALAAYQNPDGGFGHALEPDIRTPDSSVIATTIALQILHDLRVPTEHPLWHGAMKYLSATYDHEKHLWWSVPANVSEHAHAPWWNPADPGGGSLTLNPRAEIVGYLFNVHDLPEYLPTTLREELLEAVVHELESRPNELERHELQCAVRLVETEDLPAAWKERVMRVIHIAASEAVSRHPDEWAGYVLTPLDVVSSAHSPLYPKYADVIPANIEFILAQQHSEGYWSPTWSWSDGRVTWAEVENDLRSLLTGHYLECLRRFDAIDRG